MPEQDDKRLTMDELDALRDAGFSPEFLTVVRRDPETVGEQRNSAREGARQLLRTDYGPDLERFEDATERKGDYFQRLAQGELAEAFYHADIANTRLLLDTFGRDYLIERLIDGDSRDPESSARYVDERIDNYGDGIIP